ncbi:hypothetical protein C8Q79DRAFT_928299 [Trametes meyenii]|nr:hypothetical protein C8Q79DRAFT_928299 [Trametes meyenii]
MDTTHTVVQQVLLIDEIVRNILAHLPSAGCSKTLARMTGLSPLCQLLPTLEDDKSSINDASITSKFIEDEDWARFTHYARRVRKLHYHCREDPSERLRQSTFAALVRRAARVGAPLLPRLEELSWLQFSQDITHYLHFISPSLRRITVYVQVGATTGSAAPPPSESEQRHAANLLRLLDAQSPDVEELCLEGIELPHSLEPLLAFKRLRNLHLGSVTASVAVILSYCSAMPNLSSLSADLTHSHSSSDVYPSLIDRAQGKDGPSLDTLQVIRVAGSPSSIEELLAGVSSPTLHTASLTVSAHEHDASGGGRCAAVLGTRFAASLHTVRVRYTLRAGTGGRAPTDARAFAHYARPLFPLRGLRACTLAVELEVEGPGAPVSIADADVRAMAEAWPALVSLDVHVSVGGREGAAGEGALPCVTALEAFARCCPGLVNLRLPVRQDVAALEAWDDTGGEEMPRTHGLRSIWLSGVWFTGEDSRWVMQWLRHVFPLVDLRPMLSAGVLHGRSTYV